VNVEAPDKAAMEKEDVQILKASSQSTIQYRTETTIANGAFRAADERQPTRGVCVDHGCLLMVCVSNPASRLSVPPTNPQE